VKRVQLKAVRTVGTTSNRVLLADKDGFDALESLLGEGEWAFLKQCAAQETANFFFPRTAGSVFVRLLKTDKDASADAEAIRIAGNGLLAELRQYKIDEIVVENHCKTNRSLLFAEGLALGSYQFFKYFSHPEKRDKPLREIALLGADEAAVAELDKLVEAVFLARNLVNEPFSTLDAPRLGEEIEAAALEYGFSAEVLGKEKIEALKMGGLLAINRASEIPPRFAIMEWKPEGAKNEKPLVLVGKGVVYDTGGLSLKPTEGMEYMKCDMGGAASVIGIFAAVCANKLPVHLVGLIPITDNKIGREAISPGDVITMHSGTTVEVLNTDAEGRIILGDALHYAKKYAPGLVIDFATLTGAAVRALGNVAICYMGTASKDIKRAFEDSGDNTYERLVEFPLWREYGEELKSSIADLKNIGGVAAGAITAGKFLEHFTDYPWLHLDIAGPAYLRAPSGYRLKDGTGVGVRLTYDFIKRNYL
jgi:leucyl aminopeptidase